jgi:hypothetical protein
MKIQGMAAVLVPFQPKVACRVSLKFAGRQNPVAPASPAGLSRLGLAEAVVSTQSRNVRFLQGWSEGGMYFVLGLLLVSLAAG